MSARFCGSAFLSFALLVYAAAFASSVWNIVMAVEGLRDMKAVTLPPCAEILHTFLLGVIVASALVLLAFAAGLAPIFILVWAILGHMWILDVEAHCRRAPDGFLELARRALTLLWFNLASFTGCALGACCGCWCSVVARRL
jgi:hypothetical protein